MGFLMMGMAWRFVRCMMERFLRIYPEFFLFGKLSRKPNDVYFFGLI